MRNNYGGRRPSFRERLAQFFYGRNGFDALCYLLWAVYFILSIVHLFMTNEIVIFVMYIVEYTIFGYIIFRAMSRNLPKRRRENEWLLSLFRKVKAHFALQKNKRRDRKTHVYKKCPSCKNVLRLPKKKGKHTVKCPCCQNRFDVKI